MKSYGILLTKSFLLSISFQIVLGAYVEIGNPPSTAVSVHEDPSGATFLYSFVAYPSSATCGFTGTNHANFAIASSGAEHLISTIASPSFDFGMTPNYALVVECAVSGVTATATLSVSITENSAPVYSNLPGTVTISATTVKATHAIFTVSYTDTDSDPPLTYSNLATTPAGGPFSISGDQLTVTSTLLGTTVTSYSITFDVTDGRTSTNQQIDVTINVGCVNSDRINTRGGASSVDLRIHNRREKYGPAISHTVDVNSAPAFVGSTDVTQTLPEFTTGRLLIYDIDESDANADNVQFAYSTVDAANSIFDLVGATGEIYLISGNTLDFENPNNEYTFLVTVSDYLATQATIFTLTLSVSDVNEAPTYTGTPDAVTLDESAAGTVVGTLSALCTDPDNVPPDNISYSILFSVYSSYFSIDSVTSEVTLANTWDFDDSLPSAVNLTVRCSDRDGVSDDATYSITFLDINDNDPVCAPSITTYSLAYSQTVDETILNLKCSDVDSTVNAQLNYSTIGHSSGYSVAYFDVDAYGNVSIRIALNMTFNTTFYVTVLVTDNGTPSRSSTVTLTVSYTEAPLIINYTYEEPCFFCTSGVITMVSALSLFGFMLLILAIVLITLKCCYAYENRKIIESLSKKKKKRWRICDCCRPGERKKPKKSKEEIEKAEKDDREYMRARNALLGAEDPQRGIDRQWRKGPTEKAGVHKGSSSGRGAPTIASISTDISFRGRDKTPAPGGPTVAGIESLTDRQKLELEKFKAMRERATEGQAKPGPSRQAASDMVWTFQGRDK